MVRRSRSSTCRAIATIVDDDSAAAQCRVRRGRSTRPTGNEPCTRRRRVPSSTPRVRSQRRRVRPGRSRTRPGRPRACSHRSAPTSTSPAPPPRPLCPDGDHHARAGATSVDDCVPVQSADAVAISAGADLHSCALLGDGTVRCWGDNSVGQLGNGTTTDSNVPVVVSGLDRCRRHRRRPYGSHTCALLGDGTARCWGSNTSGQLGNGTTTSSNVPVTVSGVYRAVAITAGRPAHVRGARRRHRPLLGQQHRRAARQRHHHRLERARAPCRGSPTPSPSPPASSTRVRVLGDGTARCWGLNDNGQLGNGTTTDSNVPVVVSGLTDAVAITAGNVHTCAVLGDGTARCWGRQRRRAARQRHQHQLERARHRVRADATPSRSPAASPTRARSSVTAPPAAGATTASGSSATAPSPARTCPSPCPASRNAAAIAAGWAHTCAVLGDGSARCWGLGSGGQLGNGTWNTFSSNVPVAVVGIP